LEHADELAKIVELLKAERVRLFEALEQVPSLKPYPTRSNFILCQLTGMDAAGLKQRLAEQYGIFVRYFNKPRLRDHIRISVGRPQDTDAFIKAMDAEVWRLRHGPQKPTSGDVGLRI
jgi:histidinol-phosphate aminotransferase